MTPMNNMYSKPMPVSAGKVYPADQPMVRLLNCLKLLIKLFFN